MPMLATGEVKLVGLMETGNGAGAGGHESVSGLSKKSRARRSEHGLKSSRQSQLDDGVTTAI